MILRIFYAGMVVYTPIYLHEYIGFAWSEIGVMFTIMLLPFVLLEYPLGKMADSRFGEKEILSAGFICMALFTAILSFVSLPSLILWTALLFMTRIGASAVEIMSETYFFKKIDWGDSNLLSFFRIVDPIAYIITPLVVSVLIYFFDFRWVFLALSVIVLFGLRYSLSIKDTL
jgi:MFS family permease